MLRNQDLGPTATPITISNGDMLVVDGEEKTVKSVTSTGLVRIIENGEKRPVGKAKLQRELDDATEITVIRNE